MRQDEYKIEDDSPCFNSRTPRGGATLHNDLQLYGGNVSTRAPREGVRPGADVNAQDDIGFNSRTPRGGATGLAVSAQRLVLVSTRAPREGVRRFNVNRKSTTVLVSTRAPREGVRR